MVDYIVVGAGFAGAVMAEKIASTLKKKVLVLEKRSHIGGNCYDEVDASGVRIHTYGPHLFHTNNSEVYTYLSQFTSWQSYTHHVVACIDNIIAPLPFNINTLYALFDAKKAKSLETLLIQTYGEKQKIPILELLKTDNEALKALGEYIYEKVFVHYTAKQWGILPTEIDASVTARVPILTSRDNRYFSDTYQVVPKEGYTKLFERMLSHQNIEVELNCDALNLLHVRNNSIYYKGEKFEGKVIFTGMLDALFKNKYQALPYRSIDLKFEVHDVEYYQKHAVINYPNEHSYTRITEFKHIQKVKSAKTTILKEYPQAYVRDENTPYYPFFTTEAKEQYALYEAKAKAVDNLIILGRLAEYKYYDMDDMVERALEVFENEVNQ